MYDDKRLRAVEKLVVENNRMLHKMRRAQILGTIFTVVYWLVIIGVGIGAFYFVQPYIESLYGVYGDIQGGVSDVRESTSKLPDLPNVSELLKSFGN